MKQSIFKLCFVLLALAPLMFLSSCEKDEPKKDDETNEFQPVLDENFTYMVEGNNVKFTTTITGNVWVTVNEVDYNFADKKVTVNLPNEGEYTFTCSSLGSGAILTSDPFIVKIDQNDLSFLDEGLWKSLSGGANKTKTWRLDINADGETKFWAGPMYFSGFENEALGRMPYWAWDVLPDELPYDLEGNELSTYTNWEPDYANNSWIMAAKDYGTITFDGANSVVTMTDITGAESSGSFTFTPETWKLNLTGVVLPIDTARLNEPQFTDENLAALRIFSLTDSSMQIGIKRSYEGFDDDGNQKVSEWTCIYNFIVVGFSYPEPEEFTPEEAPKTSITASDLEGTWEFADIPMGWIGYTQVGNQGTTIPARLFEKWNSRADVVATLTGWGLNSIDSVFTAHQGFTFVFNGDGTCTLNGEANTYTVSNGVITFGSELQGSEFNVTTDWLAHALTGTEVTVIDVNNYGDEKAYEPYTPEGLWIGQQNDGKNEYKAFQLVKQ